MFDDDVILLFGESYVPKPSPVKQRVPIRRVLADVSNTVTSTFTSRAASKHLFSKTFKKEAPKEKISINCILPQEVLLHIIPLIKKILTFLPPNMLARAARTCSEWNRLTNDHTIWSGLFLRKWGQLPDDGDYLEAAIDMTLHNIQNANVFKHCYKLKKLRLINHPKTYGKNQSNEKAVEYNNNNNDYQPIVPEDLHLIDRELSPPPKRVKTSKSIIAKRAMKQQQQEELNLFLQQQRAYFAEVDQVPLAYCSPQKMR